MNAKRDATTDTTDPTSLCELLNGHLMSFCY